MAYVNWACVGSMPDYLRICHGLFERRSTKKTDNNVIGVLSIATKVISVLVKVFYTDEQNLFRKCVEQNYCRGSGKMQTFRSCVCTRISVSDSEFVAVWSGTDCTMLCVATDLYGNNVPTKSHISMEVCGNS